MLYWRITAPVATPKIPSGTTIITAIGIDQLSYSAANAKNTATAANA